GLDINRDALLLQSPEGHVLKAVRDRLQPRIGFNLHNQNWRTSVGMPPRPATISLLSVAFDKAGTENEGRRLTKRTCAIIRDALEPLAPGQIGRYDEDFEVRAFGDNITLWGTPVVLIETGPWASSQPDPPLVRLNFVAILTALDALASGRVASADPARYEMLPVNDERLFYILIKHASIVNGAGVAAFTGDVGITTTRRVRSEGGARSVVLPLTIDDLGDLRIFSGLTEIDGTGLTVAPLFDPSLQAGAEVALPRDWAEVQPPRTISVGEPAVLVVLKPSTTADRFIVVRVIQ
ncbi:MAG TPA: hypothetical protein VFS57_03985, partial [Gemmatimonadaceae bacterium]|nr:hypothetical protein [Gemmatimonadaceae bacterium]